MDLEHRILVFLTLPQKKTASHMMVMIEGTVCIQSGCVKFPSHFLSLRVRVLERTLDKIMQKLDRTVCLLNELMV